MYIMGISVSKLGCACLALCALAPSAWAFLDGRAVADGSASCACSGYRYYSPEMGRWLNRDPMTDIAFRSQLWTLMRKYDAARDRNPNNIDARPPDQRIPPEGEYLFVDNDPIGAFDPFGLEKCSCTEPCNVTFEMQGGGRRNSWRLSFYPVINHSGCCRNFKYRFWTCSYGWHEWDRTLSDLFYDEYVIVRAHLTYEACDDCEWKQRTKGVSRHCYMRWHGLGFQFVCQ